MQSSCLSTQPVDPVQLKGKSYGEKLREREREREQINWGGKVTL